MLADAKLTAYIPCYNVEAHVESAIQALLRQTRPPDEILIIDDGSTDRTLEIASRHPVRVIRHGSNKGLAAARNTAFLHARCGLVAALDADVAPSPDWLERLLEAFADPRVAGSGGRLIEKHTDTAADEWRALQLSQDLGETRIEIVWPSHKRLGGFGTIFRKEAVRQAGGYDESLSTNYEDVDMSERLLRARHKLIFEPRAVAYHLRRDTLASVVRTAWRWNFWIHYRQGGYNNIWLKALMNFRWARALMTQHVTSGRLRLLPIDAALPWKHTYWDLRYHFSSRRLPPGVAKGEVSAMYWPWPLRPLLRRYRGA